MQKQFSETLKERDDLQLQLTKALEDAKETQQELVDTRKLLEDTVKNAAKSVQNQVEEHQTQLDDLEKILMLNHQKMKDEKARLEGEICCIEEERAQALCERDQLRENRDQLKEEQENLQKQVQELCNENERLNDQRKKEAELNATGKNQLKDDLQKLKQQLQQHLETVCSERDLLQLELSEMTQKLEMAIVEQTRLTDDGLAKTQQVKQYKKQVDNFRVLLQESNAKVEDYHIRLEQCKHDLAYCQKDLRTREEHEQNMASTKIESLLYSCLLLPSPVLPPPLPFKTYFLKETLVSHTP